ncbi:SDR family oxidoreductase [Mycolicibacterium vaccae]|uniref:Short chain dehydrogenase n=1 Tax=Mycolicibacterium vaccae ATCC 25954 TaxID=1194972 RepID=K0UQI0_MYCVA|nr:SDR family oxidoreductase [Mycolicibacterium vaccae]ANI40536.1 short-chain dehydrogenase [Mycolicibacterium vaccae 95051]EJZ07295.1 short chain dehydrogenase [Mycolicibacterium vaccae ATCC 25954]MCV7059805.1 SDR family oxidoreductase [Mycolicibacterium vaccae]
MSSVAGKTVFITGGARGVGAEVARRLHAKGASLVLTDLDEAALTELRDQLGAERVHTVVADVRELTAMQDAAAAAVDRFGGIDVVMANAGIATYGSVLQVDPEAFRTLMDVNVVGVFNTVRATLPSVLERRGYVLIVSSLAAYAAAPGLAPYNSAKAAVEHLANALRLEVGFRGVAVGSAHMSWIDTPMVRDTKVDLPTFTEMLSRLPFPLNRTTSVEACGAAFVAGIEKRKRQINCPRWVGALRWLKPVLSTPVGEGPVRRFVPDLLPRMDAEVAALGRSVGTRTQKLADN